jgi:hemolysin III
MSAGTILMSSAPTNRVSIEELANAITHGVGLVFSIIGFVILLVLALMRGGPWQIAGCAIYGTTLVSLYAASTLYHGVPSPRLKRALLIFDHCAIYLLIAGTYTPFLLVNLRGPWGWSLFGVMWGLALAGILYKLWFAGHFPILSTSFYILMSWVGVVAVKPVLAHIPAIGLLWLAVGGLMYMLGVVFYASKKIPFNHVIWHLFVMAGSTCHYVAILYSVFPHSRA